MATYKDDLDILKAAEKADTNKLTFNAITELDNKGLLSRYGNEGGTGGGVLVVNADVETGTFDKTWKEINEASFAVIKILDDNTLSTFLVVETNSSPIDYTVKGVGAMGNDVSIVNAVASSENDYPVAQMG